MDVRPQVRKTYGSNIPRNSSSSSIIFEGPPSSRSNLRFSSPPSSPLINTPSASSPRVWPQINSRESSPLFPETETQPLISKLSSEYEDSRQRGGRGSIRRSPQHQTKPASLQSSLQSFFAPLPRRKRPLQPSTSIPASPSVSNKLIKSDPSDPKLKSRKLSTQLHLTHLPLLHTCAECGMSFVRGGEDEGLHRKHHVRVMRGIIWDGLDSGRRKAKDQADCGWRVVRDAVKFGSGKGKGTGKVVRCDGSWAGSKLEDILQTVDTVLSSPPLLMTILDECKIFLFITSSAPPSTSGKRRKPNDREDRNTAPRERIVGVLVAQGIKWAMRVLRGDDHDTGTEDVDSGGGVICDPTSLSTPLGIHRLFTIPSYRSLGLAQILLDAACDSTVYGCTFDPRKGEVAFSQPTESGRAVMEKWGGGSVRVFVDDESQL